MFSCMTQLMFLPLSLSLTHKSEEHSPPPPPPPTRALPYFVCMIVLFVTNPLHRYLINNLTLDLPEYQRLVVFSLVLMVEHSYKSHVFGIRDLCGKTFSNKTMM